jgi:hypothetical protein
MASTTIAQSSSSFGPGFNEDIRTSVISSSSGGSSFWISEEEKQNHPRFAKLLDQIFQFHISSENAVSQSTKAQFEASQSLLLKEKQSYFQAVTLQEELRSIVRDFQIESTVGPNLALSEFGLRSDPQVRSRSCLGSSCFLHLHLSNLVFHLPPSSSLSSVRSMRLLHITYQLKRLHNLLNYPSSSHPQRPRMDLNQKKSTF